MSKPMFERMALIGVGLIGSSIALGAKRAGLVSHITGSARTKRTVETALRLGILDEGMVSAREAAKGADLVVLCAPVGVCGALAREISHVLTPGAIVTDVGSVKSAVVEACAPHVPEGVHFVPGHPIAGTEHSGPEAGFADLFDGRWCILTPLPETDAEAVSRLRAFWEGLGSNVEIMTPRHHDRVLAITSHVPHLIAFNIVNTAAHLERITDKEVIKFSAGGFRDFTRIAASDPTMWRDIFMTNKEAVLEMLGRFSDDLANLQSAIRDGDGDELFKLVSDARTLRRGVIAAGQDTADPDFGRRASAERGGDPDAGSDPEAGSDPDTGSDEGGE